jgi:hypothetical protein
MTEPKDTGARRVHLSYQDRMLIDLRVRAVQPKPVFAYTLCVLLGCFGAHRFYVADRRKGMIMLGIGITIIGLPVTLVWAFTDLFRIPRMIRRRTERIRKRLTAEARSEKR